MGSLTTCLKQAGKALSDDNKAAVHAKASELRADGNTAQASAEKAADAVLADLESKLAAIEAVIAEGATQAAQKTEPVSTPTEKPTIEASTPKPSDNTLVTEDAAEKARAIIRARMGVKQNKQRGGIDPELLQAGITLAAYHVERGARKFAAYARAMVDDMGDGVKPYLQSWYMAMRSDPAYSSLRPDMDKASAVEDLDIDLVLETTATKEDTQDAPSGDTVLERDRGNASAGEPNVGEGDGVKQSDGSASSRRAKAGSARRGRPTDPRLPAGSAAAERELGDQPMDRADRPDAPAELPARNLDGEPGDHPGVEGVQLETERAGEVEAAAENQLEQARRLRAQRDAEATDVKLADIDNIRATLPYLLPGQQDDVMKAEQRFSKADGYGMLFTNSTGTGKTFSGLGVIKRFAKQGKDSVLIVVPDDKIASDWVASAKPLGLSVTQLESTKTPGSGIVVSTYANVGENDSLVSRAWDLVVADEAHSLMQGADAKPTLALDAVRAITMHPRGAFSRYAMLNRAEIRKLEELTQQQDMDEREASSADTTEMRRTALMVATGKRAKEISALLKALAEKRAAVFAEVDAAQGKARPRLVGLSATPFAYVENIDWAEGYVFDYASAGGNNQSGAYNKPNARQQFFMTNFGYSMRYGKLTKPDARVNSGMMERQFNTALKKSGALSGRALDVSADYDRRFVMVDSAVGNEIDRAMKWVDDKAAAERGAKTEEGANEAQGFQFLSAEVNNRLHGKDGHLVRRYLLEAIKAKEAVPHIREHMALGRKVVAFHDFKRGGSSNPFAFEKRKATSGDPIEASKVASWNRAVDEFEREFPTIAGGDLLADLVSPIARFTKEFPGVLLINGDQKSKDLLARYKAFNDDATGPVVALVQSEKNKGWSGHDTTGKHQRVLFNLGLPTRPTMAIQQEGRIYRTGQMSNALMRYLNTGTNWEKWAFAQTIATRADTADNLALGNDARGMKDAFIEAFNDADDYRAGHDGEGTGGKARDAASKNVLTEFDRAKSAYWGTTKKNSKTKAQEGADYYATPEPVGMKMAEWLDLRPGEDAAEPSAGHGAIARWLPEDTNRTAIEPSDTLGARLALVFDGKIVRGDFESLHIINKFDGIAMNPPFGSGGRLAIDHLEKATQHLRDYGRVVAIIPTGPAADKKFDKWFYEKSERPLKPLATHPVFGPLYQGDTITMNAFGTQETFELQEVVQGRYLRPKGASASEARLMDAAVAVKPTGKRTEEFSAAENLHLTAEILLPRVTFERAGTPVMTRIVVIDKLPDGVSPKASSNIDLTSADTITALFDRIEALPVPARQKPAEQKQPEPKPAEVRKTEQQDARKAGVAAAANIGMPVVEHTTAKGKLLKGFVRKDLTKAQAEKIDKYTFPKAGGFFIRAEHLDKLLEAHPLANDMPALSRSATNRQSAQARDNLSAIQSMAQAFGKDWKAAPEIVVVSTAEALPDDVKDSLRSMEAMSEVRALLTTEDGKVYLVADRLNGLRDAQEALFHEVLGHYGMRTVLGDSYGPAMSMLRSANQGLAAEAKAWLDKYGRNEVSARVESGMSQAEAERVVGLLSVEEALADRAAKGVSINGWKRVVAMLQRALRKIGMDKTADWLEGLTEAQTLALLVAARKSVEKGGNVALADMGIRAAPMLQRVFHGTPHRGIEKFSTDKIGTGEGAQAYGFGLYFASKREIAEYYRKTLSGDGFGIVKIDGKPQLGDPEFGDMMVLEVDQRPDKTLSGAAGYRFMRREIEQFQGKNATHALAWLDRAESSGKSIEVPGRDQTGQLYEVSIPEDDEMLLWDKPLSSQPPNVRRLLRESGLAKAFRANLDNFASPQETRGSGLGKNLYFMMAHQRKKPEPKPGWGSIGTDTDSRAWSGEREASIALLAAGIKGIKYPAEQLSGAKEVSSYNYVIFSGDDVTGITPLLSRAPLPPTIEIDGVQRPTTNSKGQPIHPTEEGVRNFWQWFGSSRVVDDEGRPLVVYHGTQYSFDAFDPDMQGDTVYSEDVGFFFTNDKAEANSYATLDWDRENPQPNVIPAYLSIKNPKTVTLENEQSPYDNPAIWYDNEGRDAAQEAMSAGYDGLIVIDNRDDMRLADGNKPTLYIAFRPEQIKSATGNSGQFSPGNPSIVLSRTPEPATDVPGETVAADQQEARSLAKAYRDVVTSGVKRVDAIINGLGGIPDSETLLTMRAIALGKIAKVDKIAGDIRAAFRKASAEDKRAIYDYLTTRGADTSAIQSKDVADMAVNVKRYIGSVGDELVTRGMLPLEARDEYRDRYLPRMYLAHLLEENDWRAVGAGKKVSDMGYLKARKDIPQEIRDVLLGEVKDPAFLAASAIAKPMRDMALLDWLEQISRHEAWIYPGTLVEFGGKKVSAYWLQAEAAALRKRAHHYPSEVNAERAKAIADRMDAKAFDALGDTPRNHADYKQVPNSPRYGRLRGMLVRKEIYDDMMGAVDFLPKDAGVWQSVFGYGGIGTKLTSAWKMSKVALNIPGQVRNAVSNMVLLQLSGVPLHKLPGLMKRALMQVASDDGLHWNIAKKYGVTESTYAAHELLRARRDLIDLEKDLLGMSPMQSVIAMARALTGKSDEDAKKASARAAKATLIGAKSAVTRVTDAASDLYQATEAVFKTVKIMHAMENGATEAEAAAEANKWLFDYSLINPEMRVMRNMPLGVPFITFTAKILPRLAEVALLHPQRFLPWVGMLLAIQAWAMTEFGGSGDEWEELKKALPKWMREKGHIAFLPFRDDAGRLQAADLSYFFPWAQWYDMGTKTAQGDVLGAVKSLGVFGGPIGSVVTAFGTNKDSFTGREIIKEGDPVHRKAASLLTYTWDLAMPPMMTTNGVVSPMWLLGPEYGGKVAQALTGATNSLGDQKATMGQAAARVVGLNVYGIDPELTRAQNMIALRASMNNTNAVLRSKLKNQGLTKEQQSDLVSEYGKEIKKRQAEIEKYENESDVPEFAKVVKP